MKHVTLVPMSNFASKKIAVDGNLYVCQMKMRRNFEESIVDLLTTLRKNRIHPIFVFDGVAPDEKREERRIRAERRYALAERVAAIEVDLNEYRQSGTVSELLRSVDEKVKRLSIARNKINEGRIMDYIAKLKSQILSVSDADFDTMRAILDAFSVPHIVAPGEGEFLCAALARHGIVHAAMTADTDSLACLAPRVITRIDGDCFHIIDLETILRETGLSDRQFVDLAILCGTDFNSNIPRVGPVKAFDLIKKHGSIEAIPDIDTTCLNHVRVREIFAFSDTKPDIKVSFIIREPDYDRLRSFVGGEQVESIRARLTQKTTVIVVKQRQT